MPGHGSELRGLRAGIPVVGFGRFGRLFDLPGARQLPKKALENIANAMIKAAPNNRITEADWLDENPAIPAGYTYFGQFVAHDISFDATPLTEADLDERALVDFRTPALDLDCVYGNGPADQSYLYRGLKVADGRTLCLRMGRSMESGGAAIGTRNDLFRLTDSPALEFNDDRAGVAVLGDRRNDENRVISQIHGAIAAFHNKVVTNTPLLRAFGADLTSDDTQFRAAAKLVRWHYQWVVVHDFLDRVCAPGTKDRVLNEAGTPLLPHYTKKAATFAYVPLEFSAAAFRFGHSMVRSGYAVNQYVGTGGERVPLFSFNTQNMGGFSRHLPKNWGIDWGYFLDDIEPKKQPGFLLPQPSFRIDALLADPLIALPEFSSAGSLLSNLAFRNLDRGQKLKLPSGQDVARMLGIGPLTDDCLWDAGSCRLDESKFNDAQLASFEAVRARRKKVKADWVDGNGGVLRSNTPLWYYILREAEYLGVARIPEEPGVGLGGQHLGPVGSRIVAETIIGLLWDDPGSFLHAPRGFTPMPEIVGGAPRFTLDRLITYALT